MDKPYKLLIIDDNKEILNALYDFFSKRKYDVVSASDGLDGLKLIETEKQNAQQYKQPLPDENTLKQNLQPRAEWNAKWQVISESIASAEKIEVTDDDLEELAKEEAEKVGIPADKLVKYYKDSNRQESLVEEKVMKFLKENNKVIEVDPDEKAKEAKAKLEKKRKTKETKKKAESKK